MVGINTNKVPATLDGPSIVGAASALMLLPKNASNLIRLERLAAFGMALQDRGLPPATSSSIRAVLKTVDIGGPDVLWMEEPYSEVLVRSIDFFGGPYRVSSGIGEHTVADIELLLDAIFRERWMNKDLEQLAFRLVQTLLIVSDLVFERVDLQRGTLPQGSPRTPIDVPSTAKLKELASATFISNEDLESHDPWLRDTIDLLALDPGSLTEPCASDITDERLHIFPFLRLNDGFRVILPLDLLVTMRFHLLRVAKDFGHNEELGRRWRNAALHRVMRLLDPANEATFLEENELITRYLLPIDANRDLHIVLATDPLTDWQPSVWENQHDTQVVLDRIAHLMGPEERNRYSHASTVLHLVIIDSPGGIAFWGTPDINDADPILFVRSDDLAVILHHEPDGPLGLLLFAEAQDKLSGNIFVTDILDQFATYEACDKSFYFSDGPRPSLSVFETGQGLASRSKYHLETDIHGVVPPSNRHIIVNANRRYQGDCPGIFLIDPKSSYHGFVVEVNDTSIFISVHSNADGLQKIEFSLMDCLAFWVWECANHLPIKQSFSASIELTISLSSPDHWYQNTTHSNLDPAVRVSPQPEGFIFEFTDTFVSLLQEKENLAERELVKVLLKKLFTPSTSDLTELLEQVAPIGPKRILNVFDQIQAPDMLAKSLPQPLTGHSQVTAQLLDDLGSWLRARSGGDFPTGILEGEARREALNAAVRYLFERLKEEIATYEPHNLLEYLISQNESLLHEAKLIETMLPARIACFGEKSETAANLAKQRRTSISTQIANRFLIEYVAACPPSGIKRIQTRDYFELLSIALEIYGRGATSDFLYHQLADFEVSILESGRLGVEREHPIHQAMEYYQTKTASRSLRHAQTLSPTQGSKDESDPFDFANFLQCSEEATLAEFGFTLDHLREVCRGLLRLATADSVSRLHRMDTINRISNSEGLPSETVERVLDRITLTPREDFMSVGNDAVPWRFNRDMAYVRRPVVQQGSDLVFGFRSLDRVGHYWVENLLSGRLQARATTDQMTRFISQTRCRINEQFVHQVADKLNGLGLTTTLSVKKFGKRRITDSKGNDLGDIDVLAFHEASTSIVAIEAKDFETARTPAEMAHETKKLFVGTKKKGGTIALHSRRVNWLNDNIDHVAATLGISTSSEIKVLGVIVTSELLITPLATESLFPVIPLDDLTIGAIGIDNKRESSNRKKKGPRRRRHR